MQEIYVRNSALKLIFDYRNTVFVTVFFFKLFTSTNEKLSKAQGVSKGKRENGKDGTKHRT